MELVVNLEKGLHYIVKQKCVLVGNIQKNI